MARLYDANKTSTFLPRSASHLELHNASTLSGFSPEIPAHPAKFLDPMMIVTLVLLVAAVALIIFTWFCGKKFRTYIRRKMPAKTKEQDTGPGFGFDGLTEAEVMVLREKEEARVREKAEWFIKLPEHPPVLELRNASPLLPGASQDSAMSREESKESDFEKVDLDLEPMPHEAPESTHKLEP